MRAGLPCQHVNTDQVLSSRARLVLSIMSEPIDILLVDDEPRNLDALEVILSDPGYRLIRAGGGDEALRLLDRKSVV